MQGALASPNLVTFQRTKSVQTETFQGEQGRAGQDSPPPPQGEEEPKEPEEKERSRFSPSSTKRRCRIEEGASPSSPSVRSRTAGSETLRSRGGGLDAMVRVRGTNL